MNKYLLIIPLLFTAVIFLTGCTSMLPTTKATIESPWETFDDAKRNFDRILPYKTKNEDLKKLTFTLILLRI
jgi:hypothetical protein